MFVVAFTADLRYTATYNLPLARMIFDNRDSHTGQFTKCVLCIVTCPASTGPTQKNNY